MNPLNYPGKPFKAKLSLQIALEPIYNFNLRGCMDCECVKRWLALAESVSKIAALIAAALFFGWKWLSGWLIVNLQLSLEASRQAQAGGNDLLTVQVKLDKGTTDSLWLRDVSIRITDWLNLTEAVEVRMDSFDLKRLRIVSGRPEGKRIVWEQDPDSDHLSLSPGESMHLGRVIEVASGNPLLIEVAVYGDRVLWRKRGFQWRSSIGCPPIVQAPVVSTSTGSSETE